LAAAGVRRRRLSSCFCIGSLGFADSLAGRGQEPCVVAWLSRLVWVVWLTGVLAVRVVVPGYLRSGVWLRVVRLCLDWSSSAGSPKRPLFLLMCSVRIAGSSSSSISKRRGGSLARRVQPRARGCAQACQLALRTAGAGVQCRPAAGSTLLTVRGRDESARMKCKRGRRIVRVQCAGWPRQPLDRGLWGRGAARVA